MRTKLLFFILTLILLLGFTQSTIASDWPSWRGPTMNGVSPETGLISNWSVDGENLIWRADFISRSTPIVMNGKVYVFGRSGNGITKQERVACFDAENGKLLWEHHHNVYNTAVPHKRVAWSSMAGDPETGNVYVIGGGGLFYCFSENGKVLWHRKMIDEFNVRTGYGGRTVSPIVDEDLVIIAFVSSSWGSHAPPFMRYYAFDKRTGEVRWVSAPGGRFTNPNVYSTPVVANINGERLLISGNADGGVYAMKVRTGEKVWQYKFSKRGLHSSVIVDGNIVFAAHGEENFDTPVMGRVVAIDATGKGDITKTHEIWRIDGMEVGFTSLLLNDGRLYFVDNSANLFAVDAKTGKEIWDINLGTVGKASPVWADNKIFYPEVNGRFRILEPGQEECKILDSENLTMPDGRYAELYGSPAVAYGRVYFASEEGVYCLGNKNTKFTSTSPKMPKTEWQAPKNSEAAYIQVVPADVFLYSGNKNEFKVRAYDDKRRFIKEVEATWSLKGLGGSINNKGEYMPASKSMGLVGFVEATYNDLKSQARVRLFSKLPWSLDFESIDVDKNPAYWLGAGSARSPATKFIVKDLNGNKVLNKPVSVRGLQRGIIYIGPPDLSNYTMQVDVMSEKLKRKISDIGLINSGYTIDLMGTRQKIEIRSWMSEVRMAKNVTFRWQPDTWYTIKFSVDATGDKAMVKAKVWKKSDREPNEWTLKVEDPLPIHKGAPGMHAFSKTNVYFDNLKIINN
ncbi:PQQ-binding-like beta-propeller repeat protein [candidate division KSB1 bacterium]|nr:PQQ-binding-like beta-propeller repeat protein [candidate division KSB1 bacterium]